VVLALPAGSSVSQRLWRAGWRIGEAAGLPGLAVSRNSSPRTRSRMRWMSYAP